jgi:hypothetical protein
VWVRNVLIISYECDRSYEYDRSLDVVWVAPGSTPGVLLIVETGMPGLSAGRRTGGYGAQVGEGGSPRQGFADLTQLTNQRRHSPGQTTPLTGAGPPAAPARTEDA